MSNFSAAAGLAAAALLTLAPAQAQWMPSWYASPQPAWDRSFVLPMNVPSELRDETVFERTRVSVGGPALRVVYSNRYGAQPLRIGGASVRVDGQTSVHRVLFGGRRAVEIAPGAEAVSDPVPVAVAPLASVWTAAWFPAATPVTTFHWGAQQTALVQDGDHTGQVPGRKAHAFGGRMFLSALLVSAPRKPVVVALGDSITDGNGSTPERDRRWPDQLADRLSPTGIPVINAGISGGQLLADGMGRSALARLEQDVLAQAGVKTAVILIGTNDIGWPGGPFAPKALPMTLERLVEGYQQLVALLRSHGVRVVLGTVPPFEHALAGTPLEGHYSVSKDQVRKALNDWIRTRGGADAVADFDALLRDPSHPARLLPKYDSGDHLHPGDAGYAAMARLLDDRLLFGGPAGTE
ncbi:SGNH/GDSL hydrolase family protein [Massilia arenosa]|uniref:SGNH/GDSL hydrolase family protein n=1 Tax=Zemynaea arenosa TaxID=2561931 RepID=A0A4Y9SM23_9BURK|nr:SGNH/GDSL hydrolase family protein [Massilia arenosa]TFW23168.1 SGNH/GDSL hydrolase family protein [Massilia arenosa]